MNWKKVSGAIVSTDLKSVDFSYEKLGDFLVMKPTPLPIDAKRIGGKIFYGHLDNQAHYRFFTEDEIEITNWSVPTKGGLPIGLDDAYYYTSDKAEGVADRFYVFNNELVTRKQWGKYNTFIGITTDGIGLGKSNTKTALEQTGWEDNSIFKYISDFNDDNDTGCDDWYIGSEAEQEKLRTVSPSLVDWYTNRYVWAANEASEGSAYYWPWDSSSGRWNCYGKNHASNFCACFAMRSF